MCTRGPSNLLPTVPRLSKLVFFLPHRPLLPARPLVRPVRAVRHWQTGLGHEDKDIPVLHHHPHERGLAYAPMPYGLFLERQCGYQCAAVVRSCPSPVGAGLRDQPTRTAECRSGLTRACAGCTCRRPNGACASTCAQERYPQPDGSVP